MVALGAVNIWGSVLEKEGLRHLILHIELSFLSSVISSLPFALGKLILIRTLYPQTLTWQERFGVFVHVYVLLL